MTETHPAPVGAPYSDPAQWRQAPPAQPPVRRSRFRTHRKAIRATVICSAIALLCGGLSYAGYRVYQLLNKPSSVELKAHLISSTPDPRYSGYLTEVVDIVVSNQGRGSLADVSFSINDDSGDLGNVQPTDAEFMNFDNGPDAGSVPSHNCHWDAAVNVDPNSNVMDCGALGAGSVKDVVFRYDIKRADWAKATITEINLRHPGGLYAKTDGNVIAARGSDLAWSEQPTAPVSRSALRNREQTWFLNANPITLPTKKPRATRSL